MRMKKIASLLLALVLVLAMAIPAFADAGEGKITIENPIENQEYRAYKMFDLESFDESGAYSYKVTEAWVEFVTTEPGNQYFTKNANDNYVFKKASFTDEQAPALAKAAIAYATKKGMTPDATLSKNIPSKDGLDLGYYVIDSTLGILCALTTTDKEANIREKNEVPSSDKKVQEDNGGAWDKTNDAEIGQIVNFRSVVKLPKGSKGVVFHDEMCSALELVADSVKVYTDAGLTQNFSTSNYSVKGEGKEHSACTFEVVFNTEYLENLTTDETVYVGYSAKLNNTAVVGGNGNLNTSKVSYGDKNHQTTTPDSTTKTYTWEFSVFKYTKSGTTNNPLENVKFALLSTDKTKVAVVNVAGKIQSWVDVPAGYEALEDETQWPEGSVLSTDAQGNIKVQGVDSSDKYYLHEIKTLDGYNKLTVDKEIQVTASRTGTGETQTMSQTALTAEVENQSGAVMPETGGIGTTIFYVVGSILLVGAAVLLITKRRMNSEK